MEIKRIIKNEKGNFSISTLFIVFILLIFTTVIFEYVRLQIVAQGVRDAVQSAITETCEDNYANIYNGIREGYSGGYKRNGDKWEENISAGDVYSRLDDKLRTHEEGGCHVKYSGETVEYRLSGLTAQITNAPFAPKNTEEKNQLTCSAEIDLEVPLSFGWQFLPPMKIHLPIKGGYTPKF